MKELRLQYRLQGPAVVNETDAVQTQVSCLALNLYSLFSAEEYGTTSECYSWVISKMSFYPELINQVELEKGIDLPLFDIIEKTDPHAASRKKKTH